MDDSAIRALFPSEKRKDILIAAAVYEEIEPLLGYYGKFERKLSGRKDSYFIEIHGQSLRVLVTGPGMVNTSQGITAAIELKRPDLIIQTGCAGGFEKRGIGIGDVAVATSERDIHLGIESEDILKPPSALPFNVPGILENGDIEICPVMCEAFFKYIFLNERHFNVSMGPFITVSTVTATDERASLLDKWYGPVMESMEGAGTAQVSRIYGIPFAEVRAVSNFVGKRDKSSWNLPLAFRNASAAVRMILKGLGC